MEGVGARQRSRQVSTGALAAAGLTVMLLAAVSAGLRAQPAATSHPAVARAHLQRGTAPTPLFTLPPGAPATPEPSDAPAPPTFAVEAVTVHVRVPYPGKPLSLGSRGPSVAEVQRALGGIAVDGVFGRQTLRAVKAFQAAHHLQVDGVVGPITWAALFP